MYDDVNLHVLSVLLLTFSWIGNSSDAIKTALFERPLGVSVAVLLKTTDSQRDQSQHNITAWVTIVCLYIELAIPTLSYSIISLFKS